MLKKILLIAATIFIGFNFGIISGMLPIYFIVSFVLFPKDPLNANIMAGFSIISAAIASITTYIYSYRKKREHEDTNVYLMTLAISFIIGAIVMAIGMFIYSAGDPYRIPAA